MVSVASSETQPATSIVTTAETLAANIGPLALAPPPAATAVVIRGTVTVTTGTTVTELVVRLRQGLNNTTTALVDTAKGADAAASATLQEVAFEFIDTNLAQIGTGYSLTVVQVGAGTNGTITDVTWEVDYVVP